MNTIKNLKISILIILIIAACGGEFGGGLPLGDLPEDSANTGNEQPTASAPILSFSETTFTASSNLVPSGSSITVELTTKDEDGVVRYFDNLELVFDYSGGTSTGFLGDIINNNNGTYTSTFTGFDVGTSITLFATINGEAITSDMPAVSVIVGQASDLFIEDAADGIGTIINISELNNGLFLELYAISRDVNGHFVANESVNWLSTNGFGKFTNAVGSSTIYYPSIVDGDDYLIADHVTLDDTTTGSISVNWSSLVGSYRLEDNLIDDSSIGNDANNYGATFVSGKTGTGMDFAGNDEYVGIPDDDSLDLTSQGSLSVWVYMDTYKQFGGILHKGSLASWADEAYTLQLWNNSKVNFTILNNSTSISLDSLTDMPVATWTHLVASWDTSGMKIYMNGVLDNSTTSTLVVRATTGGLNVGAQLNEYYNSTYKNLPFDGKIDEISVWNKTLTQEEISYIYNSGNGR